MEAMENYWKLQKSIYSYANIGMKLDFEDDDALSLRLLPQLLLLFIPIQQIRACLISFPTQKSERGT
jgi:hypothetical protein